MVEVWDYDSGLSKWRRLIVARIAPLFLEMGAMNTHEKDVQMEYSSTYTIYLPIFYIWPGDDGSSCRQKSVFNVLFFGGDDGDLRNTNSSTSTIV